MFLVGRLIVNFASTTDVLNIIISYSFLNLYLVHTNQLIAYTLDPSSHYHEVEAVFFLCLCFDFNIIPNMFRASNYFPATLSNSSLLPFDLTY